MKEVVPQTGKNGLLEHIAPDRQPADAGPTVARVDNLIGADAGKLEYLPRKRFFICQAFSESADEWRVL